MSKTARTWTQAEEEHVRINYGTISATEIGESIERTTGAVYRRISKMNLPKPPKRVVIANPDELRRCRCCAQDRPLKDFRLYRGCYSWKCRECANAESRQWNQDHPDRCRLHMVKYRYGLDPEEMVEVVGDGRCGICGGVGEQIDHDHATNIVRGYLCKQCNRGLGHFRDNIKVMVAAIAYLERV